MQYLGTGGKWSHDLDGITKEENRVKREESLNLKPEELPVFVEQEEEAAKDFWTGEKSRELGGRSRQLYPEYQGNCECLKQNQVFNKVKCRYEIR